MDELIPATELVADVLVIGGGPAAAWSALSAAEAGARVVLVDKGYLGTSGATAPSNTGTWCVPVGEDRREAAQRRAARCFGLADPAWAVRTLERSWERLRDLVAWGYPFPLDEHGEPYVANLRGPDYMHFMRRQLVRAGVRVLDHHPALELLSEDGTVAGAAGIDRQRACSWRVRAGAVVLATGGCAFGERILGASGLTGDGYLMAAEAGAVLSGMELSAQYNFTPQDSSLDKGLPFAWATFTRDDGSVIDAPDGDRHVALARALLEGPVFARYDQASPELARWLRDGQPNCFLPFDRVGLDPFRQRFAVTLRCEGTVRGVGGIRLASDDCATDVPGLYAAGDAASRERLTGAITGGGGPNASWAIASGSWAGRGAAAFAARIGARHAAREAVALGRTGLRPARARSDAPVAEAVATVRAELLPLERNFFRRATTLRASLAQLDASWNALRENAHGTGLAALRAREAAALTATGRWAYRTALQRPESRGMHRRLDTPELHPGFQHAFEARGLDVVSVTAAPPLVEAAVS
jgi:succinate dehydrogenase/fumarate reductase flavoprotein subunit